MKIFQSFKQFSIALEEYSDKTDWLEIKHEVPNNIIGIIVGNGFFDSNKAYFDFNLFVFGRETSSSGYSNYGNSSRVFRINN